MDKRAHIQRLREYAAELRLLSESVAEQHTKTDFLELALSYEDMALAEEESLAIATRLQSGDNGVDQA